MPRLIVLTGAGLSAESGVRTFRDQNGLWENHSIDDVCNGATWRANYELVQNFYNARRTQLKTVQPNAAHLMLADWQRRYDTVLITQNVDDLLDRAGCRDVVRLHGFLPEMQCFDCAHVWNIGYESWTVEGKCPRCRSTKSVRPNIVFFGEPAPKYQILWEEFGLLNDEDVVVVIGTSGVVLPITQMAVEFRGYKILNNLAPEPAIDDRVFQKTFHMPATQAVVKIDAILRERMGEEND